MRTKDFDKQRRIKESMVRLILRDGLGGASVAKIARDAGVSPATIYVYYDSKESMVAEVFREYSHATYDYLQGMIRPEMRGMELIETIVRGYYNYTIEHAEVFSFVEQCNRCPSVTEEISAQDCCCELFDLIHEYQRQGILRKYSDQNYAAVLFAPVRQIASMQGCCTAPAEVSKEDTQHTASVPGGAVSAGTSLNAAGTSPNAVGTSPDADDRVASKRNCSSMSKGQLSDAEDHVTSKRSGSALSAGQSLSVEAQLDELVRMLQYLLVASK